MTEFRREYECDGVCLTLGTRSKFGKVRWYNAPFERGMEGQLIKKFDQACLAIIETGKMYPLYRNLQQNVV